MSRLGFFLFLWLARLSAFAVPMAVLVLMGYLFFNGMPQMGISLFFGDVDPIEAMFFGAPVWEGIWQACLGTLRLVVLTLLLSIVPGIGCGMYIAEVADKKRKHLLNLAVDILAGMPSIVMGLFGFMLILFLRHTFFPNANTGLLLSAVCLSLLVQPVLIASSREAFESVPQSLRFSALALGMRKSTVLFKICLPSALRGLMGGVVLATGRAAEDTAVILFTGVVANTGFAAGILEPFEALPFAIYYIAAQYRDEQELMRGFGAALVLLGLSCLLLLLSRALQHCFDKQGKG